MHTDDFTIRRADESDMGAVFPLVVEFGTSFVPERGRFDQAFRRVLTDENACVLVAADREKLEAYLLGFEHESFYANGPVSWVEEVAVTAPVRGIGIGRALMNIFEEWAASRGACLVGVATRRASEFYSALGYDESAAYFLKVL